MNSMVSMEIKRCNFLPEGEMAIIKDTNTLIHNIVDSELKEKDKEIERLTAESTEWESKCYKYQDIIDELEKYLEKFDFTVFICGNRKASKSIEFGARLNNNFILDKLKELKEGK